MNKDLRKQHIELEKKNKDEEKKAIEIQNWLQYKIKKIKERGQNQRVSNSIV